MRYSQDTNGLAFYHPSLEGEQVIPTSGRTDGWEGKVTTILAGRQNGQNHGLVNHGGRPARRKGH